MRPDQRGKPHAGVSSHPTPLLPGSFELSVGQDELCMSEPPANIFAYSGTPRSEVGEEKHSPSGAVNKIQLHESYFVFKNLVFCSSQRLASLHWPGTQTG